MPQKGIQGGQIEEATLDLSGADGSTLTGVDALTLAGQSLGITANNIVQLNASAGLPAVDGSLVDNVNAVSLNGNADTFFAPISSPTFTGSPVLPSATTGTTQAASDNTTKLATTAYADAAGGGGGTTGIDDNADAVAMTITINEEIGFGETVPAVQYHFRDGDVGALGVALTSGNFSTIFEANSVISGIAIVGQDNQHARFYLGERTGVKGYEIHVDSTGTSPLFKITEGSSGSRQVYLDNKSLTIFQPIAWEQDVKALADVAATLQSFELFDRGTFTIAPTVPRVLTTDTAANIRAEVTGELDKTSFQFSIVNTGASTATLAAGTNVTLVGNLVVAANDSGTFKIIFTSSIAVTIYRI